MLLNAFKLAEKKFLLMAASLIQLKYHSLEVIEIVYERASEEDAKFVEEKKQIVNKINEKYLLFFNSWVGEIKEFLPYDTEYNNWNQAVEYIDRLITSERKR